MRKLLVCGLIASFLPLVTVNKASADSEETLSSLQNSIESDSAIGAHQLEIYCRQGSVILKGDVSSEKDRERIVNIAQNTQGVKRVTDWINVGPGSTTPLARYDSSRTLSNADIASAVQAAITADNNALNNKITVAVNNGTATLRGDLDSHQDVDQVLATTLMVPGVNKVSSELTIKGESYNAQKFVR